MKLATKRIIYLNFFIVFFIITPLVIMYATGYRYNFKRNRIEKTGTMFIESIPKNSSVYINNKLAKEKTPAKIDNLLPDEYQVRVENTGYYPWFKKLSVQSYLTTYASGIVLFKKNLPILKINGNIGWAQEVPDQDKIIYEISDDNYKYIKIFDTVYSGETILYQLSQTSTVSLAPLNWSNNNKKIIIRAGSEFSSDYLVVNTETNQVENLKNISKYDFELLKWDQDSSNILYGYRNNVLYQIDLSDSVTRPILAAQLDDFISDKYIIYYIYKSNNNAYLVKKNLNDESENLIKLPNNSQYFFKPTYENTLIIYNNQSNELYIMSKDIFNNSDEVSENLRLQIKANNIQWSKNKKRLILFSNSEIWVYNITTNRNMLVTRLGQEIKNALWHSQEDYLVYQPENSLYITELDFSENKNQYKLADFESIKNIFLDRKGKNIYILGKIGNQQGIFELNIR